MDLFISCLLYGVFGVALSLAGVNVIDKPLDFLAITLLVMLIDLRHALLN